MSTISDQPGSVFVTDTTGGDVLVSTLEGVASDLEVFKDELSIAEPSSSFFPAPLLLSAHLSSPPSELGVAADDFSSPPSSPSILPAFSSSCLSSYLSESGLDAEVSSYSIVTSID